ncbi:hypothetical protein [Nakamurella panacisegetis]|nr:hypothetical protein [Nakamurella panacisegetis]
MNEDKNLAASTLAALAVICGAAGLVMMVIGFNSSEKIDYLEVSTVNAGKVAAGGTLLGFALLIWILLLLFWAWRNERRYVPAYAEPVGGAATTSAVSAAAARAVGLNRVQREAVAQKLSGADDQSG